MRRGIDARLNWLHRCADTLPLHSPAAPLHAGHLACCKVLLEEGADIEQRNARITELEAEVSKYRDLHAKAYAMVVRLQRRASAETDAEISG